MIRASSGAALFAISLLAACSTGGLGAQDDGLFAPHVNPRGKAVDGMVVGHRLMAAGQHELALENFTRAAGEKGLTGEVLLALGSANLSLGRLNQAEKLLRRVVLQEPEWPEAWNNLGVVLMERNEVAEAAEAFRRAYAFDNGQSDSIRNNLRLALAKRDNLVYDDVENNAFELVRRGSGSFLISASDEV